MGIIDILPELLLSVVDNLSLADLLTFRSTCRRVRDVLNQRFQKICLQDVGQLTAIQWAAVHGYSELIELAISNGAMIDTPLPGILKWNEVGQVKSVNRIKICDILDWANRSAESEAKDSIIRTPLFLAACFGHVKAIKVLLKQHASMQCFGQMMTPAHISAGRGDVDCLRAFIQARFNINARGTRDKTILHVATLRGPKMMKYILGGQKHRRDLSYAQFPQMLRELQGERVRQAFHAYDKNKTGFNEPSEFQRIPASVLPLPSS